MNYLQKLALTAVLTLSCAAWAQLPVPLQKGGPLQISGTLEPRQSACTGFLPGTAKVELKGQSKDATTGEGVAAEFYIVGLENREDPIVDFTSLGKKATIRFQNEFDVIAEKTGSNVDLTSPPRTSGPLSGCINNTSALRIRYGITLQTKP